MSGDLCQMSDQERFLSFEGIIFERQNVYRIVSEDQVEKALGLIWNKKINGWWHYLDKYIKLGICTKEEYSKSLREACK